MPSFSRKDPTGTAANQTNSSKLIMVGVLGAVLIGVVAVNWKSFKPRSAEAAGVSVNGGTDGTDNAEGALANQLTPEQILANLAADPTANLLRGQENSLGQLEIAPPDPFRISPTWLKSLVKPKVVDITAPAPTVTRTAPAYVFNPDSLKIQAVFKNGPRSTAIINGSPMTVGGVVAGCIITKITDDQVQFQPVGQPLSAAFAIPVNMRMH